MKFLTASGATYELEYDRFRRVGPWSSKINYDDHPDEEWNSIEGSSPVMLGRSVEFYYPDGSMRVTTYVVDIKDDE